LTDDELLHLFEVFPM